MSSGERIIVGHKLTFLLDDIIYIIEIGNIWFCSTDLKGGRG